MATPERDEPLRRNPPREAQPIAKPKVVHWEEFQGIFAKGFRRGEQVSAVGPNGSGKSLLTLELAKIAGSRAAKDGRPSRVVVIATKRRDDTIEALHKSGWPIIKTWPPAYGEEHCIIWPGRNAPASTRKRLQRSVILPLLDRIEAEGNQTVVIDEAADFERKLPTGLGLQTTMQHYWSDTRSSKISLMATTQRPRWVTVSMWSEPAWVCIFRPESLIDLKHVGQHAGRPLEVWEIGRQLGGHEFLCVRRQRAGEHELYVSKVERI